MNLNDFSKWLQYNKVKNLRGSEYFPYPLYIHKVMVRIIGTLGKYDQRRL